MKDYFSHDYNARAELRGIRKDWGLAGYGFYWCVVEILHEEGGYIKESDIDSIAYDMKAETEMAHAIINNYGLFENKKGRIYSDRVLRNIKKRAEVSEARKAAAEARWGDNNKNEELPIIQIPEEEKGLDIEQSKQFYIRAIERAFQKWLDNASSDDLLCRSKNIYDYKTLFDAVIETVRCKDYVIVARKNVPTYKFLQVIMKNIKGDSLMRLDQAMGDVELRYKEGKIKNRTNYLIATLYNLALIDIPQ